MCLCISVWVHENEPQTIWEYLNGYDETGCGRDVRDPAVCVAARVYLSEWPSITTGIQAY